MTSGETGQSRRRTAASAIRADDPSTRTAVLLAAALSGGLVVGAPAFALAVEAVGVDLPLPLLVGVGIVGVAYGGLVLATGEVVVGTVVATVVASTFAANVPLAPNAEAYPAGLGPQLWLWYLPAALSIGYFAVRGRYGRDSFTAVEYAFGGLVLWSALAAVFGAGPRFDTGVYYTLFVATGLVALGILARAVRSGVVDLHGVLSVLGVAVAGQVAFAVVQLINGGPFGFTHLGETGRTAFGKVVDLGPLGTHQAGVYVSGLAGSAVGLAALVVLAFPFVMALAATDRRRRWGYAVVGLLMLVVCRVGAKEAVRASLLLVLGFAVALTVFRFRGGSVGTLRSRIPLRQIVGGVIVCGLMVGVLLYPIAAASNAGGGGVPGDAAGGRGSAAGAGGTAGSSGEATGESDGGIGDFVDLTSLDVRLLRYQQALSLGLEHPVFGVGGANIVYSVPNAGNDEVLPVHNWYLSTLASTGIVGLSLLLGTLSLVLSAGYRLVDGLRGGSAAGVAVLLGIVGFAALSFWDITGLTTTAFVPFCIVCGAVVGERRRPSGDGAGDVRLNGGGVDG
jgi:hypothetical protein